jgi:ABC-type transport system involved in multi-copper enzyme maturation permease subunit
MDIPATTGIKYNRFLPFWAVCRADCKQTFCSWIYRTWVLLTMGAALGYLLYRYGARQEAKMVQPSAEAIADFFKWIVLGSATLVIVLTAGAICSERGTMADSVLSRGISRYQYFLGKWSARLLVVLLTFFLMSGITLAGAYFLLHSDSLDFKGSLLALTTVAVFLSAVITFGVSVSAMSSNTLVSIAIVWLTLYGGGFLLCLLPEPYHSATLALQALPQILKGYYDWHELSRVMLGCVAASAVTATVGMVHFSRRDV